MKQVVDPDLSVMKLAGTSSSQWLITFEELQSESQESAFDAFQAEVRALLATQATVNEETIHLAVDLLLNDDWAIRQTGNNTAA